MSSIYTTKNKRNLELLLCGSAGGMGNLSLFCFLGKKKSKSNTTPSPPPKKKSSEQGLDGVGTWISNFASGGYCSWKSLDFEENIEELSPYLHLIALFAVQNHYHIQTSDSCHCRNVTAITAGK